MAMRFSQALRARRLRLRLAAALILVSLLDKCFSGTWLRWGDRMRRREFIALVGIAAVAWPVVGARGMMLSLPRCDRPFSASFIGFFAGMRV